jgi:hypothetical protein
MLRTLERRPPLPRRAAIREGASGGSQTRDVIVSPYIKSARNSRRGDIDGGGTTLPLRASGDSGRHTMTAGSGATAARQDQQRGGDITRSAGLDEKGK